MEGSHDKRTQWSLPSMVLSDSNLLSSSLSVIVEKYGHWMKCTITSAVSQFIGSRDKQQLYKVNIMEENNEENMKKCRVSEEKKTAFEIKKTNREKCHCI